MPLYEIMCVATVHTSKEQLTNMLGKLAVVVHKGKGVFRRVENLGVRPLAHRMKAHMKYNEEGRFMRLYIQASPVLLADIEQRLRIDDQIVKTMTIKHKQAAPVVVQKRVHSLKITDSTSVTGILHHAPVIEYHVADTLLRLGLMREDDILALPRYKADAGWDAQRQEELLKRARGGSATAASVLQVPIPSRAEDLADIAAISAKEEAQIAAFDQYRRETAARQARERADYQKNEEEALRRRLKWYADEVALIRARALTKRLNATRKEGIKHYTVEQALALQTERDIAKRKVVRANALREHRNMIARAEAGEIVADFTQITPAAEEAAGLDASADADAAVEGAEAEAAVEQQAEEDEFDEDEDAAAAAPVDPVAAEKAAQDRLAVQRLHPDFTARQVDARLRTLRLQEELAQRWQPIDDALAAFVAEEQTRRLGAGLPLLVGKELAEYEQGVEALPEMGELIEALSSQGSRTDEIIENEIEEAKRDEVDAAKEAEAEAVLDFSELLEVKVATTAREQA